MKTHQIVISILSFVNNNHLMYVFYLLDSDYEEEKLDQGLSSKNFLSLQVLFLTLNDNLSTNKDLNLSILTMV